MPSDSPVCPIGLTRFWQSRLTTEPTPHPAGSVSASPQTWRQARADAHEALIEDAALFPELSIRALAQRHGLAPSTAWKVLGAAAPTISRLRQIHQEEICAHLIALYDTIPLSGPPGRTFREYRRVSRVVKAAFSKLS